MILENKIYDPYHIPLPDVNILISVNSNMFTKRTYRGYYDGERRYFMAYLSTCMYDKNSSWRILEEDIKCWKYDQIKEKI